MVKETNMDNSYGIFLTSATFLFAGITKFSGNDVSTFFAVVAGFLTVIYYILKIYEWFEIRKKKRK